MTKLLGCVLMTSAGRKVPLLRALRDAARRLDPQADVIAGDLAAEAPARQFADQFWQMPAPGDLPLEAFLTECRRRNVRTILPTRDGELPFWASAKSTLEAGGVSVIVSSVEGVALCIDKLAFAEWGKSEHLPIIPAAEAPDSFRGQALVVKERFGAGSRSIGLGLSETDAGRHAISLTDPLFQPLVKGEEISIDAWLTRAGAVHGLVLRRRDLVVGGESQITTTFRDPRLETQAASTLERLGLSGPVVMQAMVTEAGLAIIEVNARFGGASTASIAVGLDMLYWSLFERAWPDAPLPAFDRRQGEIRQVRAPEDTVFHDPDI